MIIRYITEYDDKTEYVDKVVIESAGPARWEDPAGPADRFVWLHHATGVFIPTAWHPPQSIYRSTAAVIMETLLK